MHIKRNLLFVIDREKDKPNGKLRFRITWNGNTVAFNVGFRVEFDRWNRDSQRCKPNTTHGKRKTLASTINKEIQRFEDTAEQIFEKFENENRIPTVSEFRNEFNLKIGKKEQDNAVNDFLSIYDEFVSRYGSLNSWSKAMYFKYEALKAHILNFDPNIQINDFTEDKLFEFVQYQQSQRAVSLFSTKNASGFKNTTIAKNMAFLKTFLKWAGKKGYYTVAAHEDFKMRLKGIDGNNREIIYLSWDELMTLYNFGFSKKYLSQVRDVFCFMCFTGLRYSDVAKLSRSDVKEDHIKVVTQKTVDGLKIELNKYSKAILDKYKDLKTENALPVISNVKMNEFLKEMAEIAGIDEPQRVVYFIGNKRYEEVYPKYKLITTHCGRRTFTVNALALGISESVIMKWTGHSSFASMKPYHKIVDELKKKSMDKFNEK